METTANVKTYNKGEIYELILVELITEVNPLRKVMEAGAMAELVASVRKVGIVEPILFRQDEQFRNIVVAGGRRVEAARQAGLLTIPGIFVAGDFQVIALIENMIRQDLTPIEEAEGLQALIGKDHYTQEELAAILGKAQNTMCETLSINNLPQEVRDDCRGERGVAKRHLVAIARKKDPENMIAAYRLLKAKLQQAAPRGQKRDPNEAQSVLAVLQRALRKIESVNTSGWTAADHNNFQDTLTQMRAGIDQRLAGPAA